MLVKFGSERTKETLKENDDEVLSDSEKDQAESFWATVDNYGSTMTMTLADKRVVYATTPKREEPSDKCP